MPEREERSHDDLRGQVRQLAKVVNGQVKRNARLEEQFAKFEKESSTRALIGAVDGVATAIRESANSGVTQEMIDDITRKVLANREKIRDAASQVPPDPVPAK